MRIENFQPSKLKLRNMTDKRRTIALIIIDGWGHSPRREGNAIALAHTPFTMKSARNIRKRCSSPLVCASV
ncbi:MAG: hypothetical protein ABI891_09090 [Acidobacteriota bacterium]